MRYAAQVAGISVLLLPVAAWLYMEPGVAMLVAIVSAAVWTMRRSTVRTEDGFADEVRRRGRTLEDEAYRARFERIVRAERWDGTPD